jgi:hypothetical protein
MPWTKRLYESDFSKAWNGSSKFRQTMEYNEILRLERLAFVGGLDRTRQTIEDIESEIAALQGVIAETVHALDDNETKIETMKNRRKNVVTDLNRLIEVRRSRQSGKDDRWVNKTQRLLPIPKDAIQMERRFDIQRLKAKHDLNWWTDKFTFPTETGKVDLTNLKRNYDQPWNLVKDEVVKDEGGGEEADNVVEDEAKLPLVQSRVEGKSKNKYAQVRVFRGGFKISGMLVMLHVMRKPSKGYTP